MTKQFLCGFSYSYLVRKTFIPSIFKVLVVFILYILLNTYSQLMSPNKNKTVLVILVSLTHGSIWLGNLYTILFPLQNVDGFYFSNGIEFIRIDSICQNTPRFLPFFITRPQKMLRCFFYRYKNKKISKYDFQSLLNLILMS